MGSTTKAKDRPSAPRETAGSADNRRRRTPWETPDFRLRGFVTGGIASSTPPCICRKGSAQRARDQLVQPGMDLVVCRRAPGPWRGRRRSRGSVTKPPASRTSSSPAAMSQNSRSFFPEAVVAAGRDPGEVERGGAEAPDPGHLRRHGAEDLFEAVVIAVALVGNAGRDQRLVQVAARRRAAAGPAARRPGPSRPRSSRRSAAGRPGRG